MKTKIETPDAPKAIGPYSQAVREGEWFFISGQIPLDPLSGKVVPGSLKSQTERVLRNIGEILKSGRLGFEHVLKTTVYLKHISQFQEMNEAYASFFREPFPARSTVEVSDLPRGVDIEIDVIAKGGGVCEKA
ncbi:MAG: RidA family protein [Elusimicrobia bacterium]|nr:RidA family protein [Elusimicrobiota bacterium]